MRTIEPLACLVAVTCGACSINVVATDGQAFQTWGWFEAQNEVAQKAAVTSGARDIPCPRGEVRVTRMPERDDPRHGGRDIVVEGCDERLTYLESCHGATRIDCEYVIIGRLDLRSDPSQLRQPPPRVGGTK
jgi:hypothetical protein